MSVRSLLDVNGASPDSLIVPGQTIALPAGAREPAAAPELDALPTQGPCWYSDTWGSPRANGRTHQGIDIFAKRIDHIVERLDYWHGKTGKDVFEPAPLLREAAKSGTSLAEAASGENRAA